MDDWIYRGNRRRIVDAEPPATPDNENLILPEEWQTPAEAVQQLRRYRRDDVRQLAANPQLWACPEHRRKRLEVMAAERCALWHFFGVR